MLKKELNTIFHSSLSKTGIDSSAINQRQGQERASISLFCLSYYLMSAWIARMGTLYLVKEVIATCFFPLSSVILRHAKFYRNFKAKWINFIAVNYFSDAVLVSESNYFQRRQLSIPVNSISIVRQFVAISIYKTVWKRLFYLSKKKKILVEIFSEFQ